ncbi:MAG: signal recognition particle protein [bacterium]
MFEALGEKFEILFKKLRGQGVITEKNVRDALREVRLALLEADVNFKVVKDFVQNVTQKAVGTEVLQSITPGQQLIKIVYDELVAIMGGHIEPININPGKLNVVLLLGLQGSGKTTLAGKLAKRYAKRGFKPMLVACDIYRPAAIHQLQVVGSQVSVPVFEMGDKVKPPKIVRGALELAERESRDLVIVDTAGRLHINEVLMDELVAVKAEAKPAFTFLVADAMTGQDAVNSAAAFNEKVGVDGVCLTKMDGDARGGAALSIRAVTSKPIRFIGVGEKLDDLEEFHPDRIASRILGMGDVVSLVEKAQQTFDEKAALELQKKIRKESFTLQDFLDQLRQVKKMGNFKDLLSMLPGVGSKLKEVDFDEGEVRHVEAIISSMTQAERENPSILNGSRRKRIAIGSGSSVAEINQLLSQFEESKKMMKMFLSGAKGMGMPGAHPRAVHHRAHQHKKKKRKR